MEAGLRSPFASQGSAELDPGTGFELSSMTMHTGGVDLRVLAALLGLSRARVLVGDVF
jgi:hypothetical protein